MPDEMPSWGRATACLWGEGQSVNENVGWCAAEFRYMEAWEEDAYHFSACPGLVLPPCRPGHRQAHPRLLDQTCCYECSCETVCGMVVDLCRCDVWWCVASSRKVSILAQWSRLDAQELQMGGPCE